MGHLSGHITPKRTQLGSEASSYNRNNSNKNEAGLDHSAWTDVYHSVLALCIVPGCVALKTTDCIIDVGQVV